MEDLYQEQTNFAGGVQPGTPIDRVPDSAYASGINTAFREIGSGMALVGCRPGLTTINTTALGAGGGDPQLDFARLYTYDTGTVFSNFLALVNRAGYLYYKNPDNTMTSEVTIPSAWSYASGTHCFSSGDVGIDGTVFSNRLFLIKQAATPELRSFTGTSTTPSTAVPWGLSPITSVAATDVGSGTSLPADDYDVAITSYHSTTGAESSLSSTIAVTTTAGERIQVTITPTAVESALYTHWRVYLRRRSTQSRLFLVSSLGTGGNIAIGTTSVYVDLTAAQITAHSTPAPSTVENAPPPASAKFVCTYGRRLLLADERNVYWSRQDKPDAFPAINYEPIETGEGDTITAIYPFSDEVALIFTTTAVWGIFGNDPQTWTFKAIDHTIGCLSHLSLIEFNGALGWWSDAYGPVYYDGTGITKLGERELGRSSYIDELNLARIARCWAGHDPKYSRVIWAVPSSGSNRNNRMFVYNYQVGKFESEQWDPMPAASLAMAYHSDGSIKLFVGSDRGHLFYFDEAVRNDGVPSGTVNGTFVGAGALSTISGTGFYDTDDGLKGRWVLIVDAEARPVTKVEISSNTSTVLTLATTPNMTTGNVYTYYIGSPDLRLGSRAYDMGRTFFRKRFDRLYVHAKASTSGATNLWLTTQINFATTATATGQSLGLGGAKWAPSTVNGGIWDSSQWVGDQNVKKRFSLFTPGQNLQINLLQSRTNQDVVISAIGVLAGVQSERYFG